MSRAEFIAKWRHEIDGWVLDAACGGYRGADLSIFLRAIRAKIEAKLGAIYDHKLEIERREPSSESNGRSDQPPGSRATQSRTP